MYLLKYIQKPDGSTPMCNSADRLYNVLMSISTLVKVIFAINSAQNIDIPTTFDLFT